MGDFHSPFNESDLVHGLDIGRKASVDAEDLALDHSPNAQVVEHFGAVFPGVCVSVLSDCLVVEPVDSSNLTSFVISSQ